MPHKTKTSKSIDLYEAPEATGAFFLLFFKFNIFMSQLDIFSLQLDITSRYIEFLAHYIEIRTR